MAVDLGQFAGRIQRGLIFVFDPRQVFGPPQIALKLAAFFEHFLLELLDAPGADQELHACAAALLLLAVPRKDTSDGLGDRKHFLRRKEFIEELGLLRNGAEPAADDEPKAPPRFAVHDARDGGVTQVVHGGQPAGVLRAPAERGFELAAEVLHVRMAQQEARQGPRIRSHVKGLVRTNAGVGTRGNVAHRVAAGLARGDSHGGQAAHDSGCIFEMDEVQLEILSRGDVGDAVGVLLRQIRHHFQLLWIQPSEGNLDTQHPRRVPEGVGALGPPVLRVRNLPGLRAVVALPIIVALPVNASAKPRFGEDLFIEPILTPQLDLHLKRIDFLGQLLRQLAFQTFLPQCIAGLHVDAPPVPRILSKPGRLTNPDGARIEPIPLTLVAPVF